jgi:ribonuclease R
LKCEFLKDRIGEEFDGVIAAVTTFGVFVELSDLYIEGLMHVSALPGDYYHFDQAKQRLIGERTRQVFQLGGAVTVRIARVDLDDRKIDLELAGVAPSRRGKTPQRQSKDDALRSPRRGKKDRRSEQSSDEQRGGGQKNKKSGAKSSKPSAKSRSAKPKQSAKSGKSAKKTKAGKAAGGRARSGGSTGKKRR